MKKKTKKKIEQKKKNWLGYCLTVSRYSHCIVTWWAGKEACWAEFVLQYTGLYCNRVGSLARKGLCCNTLNCIVTEGLA